MHWLGLVSAFLFVVAYAQPEGEWFDHIFVVVLPSASGFDLSDTGNVKDDPIWVELSKQGKVFNNYHPLIRDISSPNLYAMISGNNWVLTESFPNLDGTNLVDLMEDKGVSWKAYLQGYPGNCAPDINLGVYYKGLNPFISFKSVRQNSTRCLKLSSSVDLDFDLAAGTLPHYSYYALSSPTTQWLKSFLEEKMPQFPEKTLVVVTTPTIASGQGSNMLTFMVGPMVTPETEDNVDRNHYSLLKTIEMNWNLGNLGRGETDLDVQVFDFDGIDEGGDASCAACRDTYNDCAVDQETSCPCLGDLLKCLGHNSCTFHDGHHVDYRETAARCELIQSWGSCREVNCHPGFAMSSGFSSFGNGVMISLFVLVLSLFAF